MMRRELHAWLDGELSREELPAEQRAAAEGWEAFLAAVSASTPPSAPAWLEAGVMRALRASASPGRLPAWLRWMIRPRPIRVPPLAAGLTAALLLVVALRPWSGRRAEPGSGDAAVAGAVVYVQFLVEAPEARSVALAGDFSGWSPAIALEDPDGDGVWAARVPLAPGVHQYMFVLDGTRWVTDPHASRWTDDGFGNRNAILAVATPGDGA